MEDDRVENQSQNDVEGEVKDKIDKGEMKNNERGEQVGGGGELLHRVTVMVIVGWGVDD